MGDICEKVFYFYFFNYLIETTQSALSTLNSPVHKKSARAASDMVKPSIMSVLQDSHEEECAQPAGKKFC